MAERPHAFVAHMTAGRLRLRIPERRNDDAFFVAVRQRVSEWPGIDEVRVNPLTASVLVFFGDAAVALAYARQSDLFEIRKAEPARPAVLLADGAYHKARSLNSRIRRLTGGVVDLGSLMLLALLLAAIYEIYRGNFRTSAFSLLWHAGSLLRLWPGPEPAP